jgi:hypothetical protein
MRTRSFSTFLLIFTSLTLIVACAPAPTVALLPAQLTVMPDWQYVATATPVVRQGSGSSYRSDSGLYLTARINAPCFGAAWPGTVCSQPYMGEFVVTAPNGAEVARVMTNWAGQATVNVPPGRYIVGVRTAGYYPQAAPVAVSVYLDHYASVWISLNAGPRQAAAR